MQFPARWAVNYRDRSVVNYYNVYARQRARRVARDKRASFHAKTIKSSLFSGISHPLDRRKELKMAVIAVGSRPETPDVTKFFELPPAVVVDRRFRRHGGYGGGRAGGLRILGIHISVGGRVEATGAVGREGGRRGGREAEASQV